VSLINKKYSWKYFGLKTAVVASVTIVALTLFNSRYEIGIDFQSERCLPDHQVYIIDLKDKMVEKGGIFAFKAKGLQPLFDDGETMVKILSAVPGDKVEVNEQREVLINGEVVRSGLHLAQLLKQPYSHFIGKGELKENQYWFLGKGLFTFDSRYWGAVSNEQIIGRVYPIF